MCKEKRERARNDPRENARYTNRVTASGRIYSRQCLQSFCNYECNGAAATPVANTAKINREITDRLPRVAYIGMN